MSSASSRLPSTAPAQRIMTRKSWFFSRCNEGDEVSGETSLILLLQTTRLPLVPTLRYASRIRTGSSSPAIPITKVDMSQLTEAKAQNLSSDQATALVRVLELQAGWENHRDDPAKSAASTIDLSARRKAYDGFQTASSGYAAKYGNVRLPEPTQTMPDRLAIWCRILRAVCRHPECVCPVQLIAKVYRLTDRAATRMGKEPVRRGVLEDMAGMLRELDAVIDWCEAMGLPPYLGRTRNGDAA